MNEVDNHYSFKMANCHAFMLSINHLSLYDLQQAYYVLLIFFSVSNKASHWLFLGARVIVGCRDQGRGAAAVDEIKSASGNENVIVGLVDLASFESIRSFAKHIKETESRLDILINNAGSCLYG